MHGEQFLSYWGLEQKETATTAVTICIISSYTRAGRERERERESKCVSDPGIEDTTGRTELSSSYPPATCAEGKSVRLGERNAERDLG